MKLIAEADVRYSGGVVEMPRTMDVSSAYIRLSGYSQTASIGDQEIQNG